MKFTRNNLPLNEIATECLVIGVYEDGLTAQATAIDGNNILCDLIESGDVKKSAGSSYIYRDPSIKAKRILVVGLGEEGSLTDKTYRKVIETIAKAFKSLPAKEAVIALPFGSIQKRDEVYAVTTAVEVLRYNDYKFDRFKSDKKDPEGVQTVAFSGVEYSLHSDIVEAEAIADGVDLTRDLGNTPSNYCTPRHLATIAYQMHDRPRIEVEVLNHAMMAALGMNSLLAVAQGSKTEPQLVIINYKGGKDGDAPIVLVGKGITFDSGGISLKPAANMDEMKYDMSGAGTVLGVMKAITAMSLPLNVIGVIPACENMPSSTAIKPGDIVTSMSGKTIEILNTDAEGRLILCDALTYVERFNPSLVIDMATLTGACVGALGDHNTGLFTRDDEAHNALADALLAAGKDTGDTAWRLPLDERYDEQIKSKFADIANIGSPGAGASTAACFLERFTRNYTWAHLDIAGTANTKAGATGRPVPLLVKFLQSKVAK